MEPPAENRCRIPMLIIALLEPSALDALGKFQPAAGALGLPPPKTKQQTHTPPPSSMESSANCSQRKPPLSHSLTAFDYPSFWSPLLEPSASPPHTSPTTLFWSTFRAWNPPHGVFWNVLLESSAGALPLLHPLAAFDLPRSWNFFWRPWPKPAGRAPDELKPHAGPHPHHLKLSWSPLPDPLLEPTCWTPPRSGIPPANLPRACICPLAGALHPAPPAGFGPLLKPVGETERRSTPPHADTLC